MSHSSYSVHPGAHSSAHSSGSGRSLPLVDEYETASEEFESEEGSQHESIIHSMESLLDSDKNEHQKLMVQLARDRKYIKELNGMLQKYEHENNDLTEKTIRQEEEISKLTHDLSHLRSLVHNFIRGVVDAHESENESNDTSHHHATHLHDFKAKKEGHSFRDMLGEATESLRHEDRDGDFGVHSMSRRNRYEDFDHESSVSHHVPGLQAEPHERLSKRAWV